MLYLVKLFMELLVDEMGSLLTSSEEMFQKVLQYSMLVVVEAF